MKQLDMYVNLARMMASNGVDFIEGTAIHTGIWCGFMPHNEGCIVAAVTRVDHDGNAVTEVPTWVGTTLDLDSYISAGLSNDLSQAYITSITLASGGCTALRDELIDLPR